jgi:polyhydroxyalkanoate synthesis regulator protein
MALLLGAGVVAAQQPGPPPPQGHGQGAEMSARTGTADQARMMESLNHRLDSLVARMNRVTGAGKVAAMADVINELVAQRKVMQEHMRRMMESRKGMMRMMEDSLPVSPGAPTQRADSAAADTAGHAGHHPPK